MSDEREPPMPTATLLKYFKRFMSKTSIKWLLYNDAMFNTLRYNPHLAMEDQGTMTTLPPSYNRWLYSSTTNICREVTCLGTIRVEQLVV